MAKYLKKFSAHTDYNSFTQSEDFITPNVSHCVTENEMHYNPIPDPRLIMTFFIWESDLEYGTELYYYNAVAQEYSPAVKGVDLFDKIEVDGVGVPISTLDANQGKYTFSSSGEHIISYTLKDATTISPYAFYRLSSIIRITVPNTVNTIGTYAFRGCSKLVELTMPNSITSIGDNAFCNYSVSYLDDTEIVNRIQSINPNAIDYTCRCMA